MTGETNLATLLKTAKPEHIPGDYVFCTVADAGAVAQAGMVVGAVAQAGIVAGAGAGIDAAAMSGAGVVPAGEIVMQFKEREGTTLIVHKELADRLQLEYSFVAAWITLTVHSSLAAVGLTAAFSTALASRGISCNVVAAYYHDHIFVDKRDLEAAMEVLRGL
jgi:hypothetical protein